MRISPCLVALIFIAPSTTRAQQRPLQLEDYYRVRDVGSPELSPDGRWVAFTVGTRIEATNGTDTEVWIVPTDASVPARWDTRTAAS